MISCVRVDVVVFPGFDELDAVGPFEVLANAARGGAGVEVRLVSLGAVEEVRGSHGARLRPDGELGDQADCVVVPGGGWNDRAEEGAFAEARRGELPAALAALHRRGATIASVCTGAGMVAAAGLLDGRAAATHHRARDELRGRGVRVVDDARVVVASGCGPEEGELWSAGGVTAGLDLALAFVEHHWGRELADRIAAEMEYERRGPTVGGSFAAGDLA